MNTSNQGIPLPKKHKGDGQAKVDAKLGPVKVDGSAGGGVSTSGMCAWGPWAGGCGLMKN
ncbi:3685_t:CDS:2 [Ambispora leptoticha]|uniref:3685_t:CDS:1 n=1 Tax=Ambispora leptoticha TaxID=144679 RepID=A0A9N8YSI7_9GLOM|nr:3685_t:CDS:2 [Ambispora leptoticha]